MTNEEEKIEIELPVFGIKISLTENHQGDFVGSITSDLHEEGETAEEKAAIDAIESLILAYACADMDIDSPDLSGCYSNAFLCAIEMAVEAIGNNQ
jgi:hypothetical protein